MQILFSFLYAPIVVILLSYFNVKTVALGLWGFGVLWLLLLKERKLKTLIFPFFYIVVAIGAFVVNDFLVLKFLPLLISLAFLFFLIASYFDNDSIILHFAKKLHRRLLSTKEENYINRSTLFWIGLAFINILLHVTILLLKNDAYWIIYSSFGWYMVFILGGVVQFLHRHFVFLRRG
ncbi:MAG: hypothetical protein EOL93_08025 [Epsilonproteobacteria bacterium]|nr:hypothetical protein [Campylobacterota bacterium]